MLKIVVITAVFFFPSLVMGQEIPAKSVKDGWAIYLGAGYMFGGNIGVLGERQILLKEKFRISPFLASGFSEGTEDTALRRFNWFGIAAGVNMEYGKKHRVFVGPHVVLQELLGNSEQVKKNQLSSVSFIVGYKGTADFGLIWQVYIGDVYSQDDDPFSTNKTFSHRSQVGLGIGYKF